MSLRRSHSNLLSAYVVFLIAGLSVACDTPGVGDPCTPESVPTGGFNSLSVFLETSSAQCRTRTCIVYQLDGDPRPECDELSGDNCPPANEIDERVYCTCQCSTSGSSTAGACECPSGYTCTETLTQAGAGDYCIKNSTLVSEEPEAG